MQVFGKARKPWLFLVIKRVVRHIFPACFGKICAASGVGCQSSADSAKRMADFLKRDYSDELFIVMNVDFDKCLPSYESND